MVQNHKTKLKLREIKSIGNVPIQVNINLWKSVAVFLGVTREITELEANALLQFVLEEFKDYSITEIGIAFKKYSAGKLDFKEPHYGTISTLLVGKVLNSYRKPRNKALLEYQKYIDTIENKKEPTAEDIQAIQDDFLTVCLYNPYQNALDTDSQLTFDTSTGTMLFLKYWKAKIIQPTKEQSELCKKVAVQRMTQPKDASVKISDVKRINEEAKKILEVVSGNAQNQDIEQKIKETASAVFFEMWVNENLKAKIPLKDIKLL